MIAAAATAIGALAAAGSGYNAALTALAFAPRPQATVPDDSELPRLLVLVPAHDEAGGIAAAVESLLSSDYPQAKLRLVVIADNCSDQTAGAARAAGAEVLERTDPDRRGKGYALDWALATLAPGDHEAILMVDADCEVAAGLPRALAGALLAGAQAAQADYVVTNPGDSATAGLRAAGFALACTARPAGRERIGASAGLLGTGMLFRRELLERVPWTSYSLAEDAEYHLELVDREVRVSFVAATAVRSPMPADAGASEQQQARWEAGRAALARRGWRTAAQGLARRDPVRVHAGLEVVLPPQSVLAAGALAAGGLGAVTRSPRAVATAVAAATLQTGAIIAALRLADAPASTYRSLAGAPALILRKLRLLGRISGRRGPQTWQRTSRDP